MYCKHCKQEVFGSTHSCAVARRDFDAENDGSSFLISAIIGAATDSAIIGGLIGGDFVGGAIGDMLDGDLFD